MNKTFTVGIALSLVVAGVALTTPEAHAQGFVKRIKKAAEEGAKRAVEDRTEEKSKRATDAALDKADCAATGNNCKEATPSEAAAPETGAAASATASLKPGEGAWRNFDFVPGERALVAEDFSADNVGDFPKRFELGTGSFEVVEWEGRRFLSTNNSGSEFSIPLSEQLPERFTLEFDYSAHGGNHTEIYFGGPENGNHVSMGEWQGGVDGAINAMGVPPGDQFKYQNQVFPVRIMADGQHVKIYMGADRVANVPKVDLGRSRAIRFVVPGTPQRAALIGNIRLAAGGRDLYDTLAAEGHVSTGGIFFDIGSDRIRPESTPTLTQIGRMLEQHPDLKVSIEGHTDNAGNAQANLALSDKRAAAVKAYLVAAHKVDAGRLVTKGLGDTKPVAPNTTAEGRQQNRRVELVKL